AAVARRADMGSRALGWLCSQLYVMTSNGRGRVNVAPATSGSGSCLMSTLMPILASCSWAPRTAESSWGRFAFAVQVKLNPFGTELDARIDFALSRLLV